MKYYKRQWREKRCDEYANWGTSIWYFEIDEKGYPNRQIEKYDNGKVLKYDLENMEDEFGGLGDQIIEIEEFSEFEITKEEFTKEWK
jgi:hypothetical protein